MKLLAIFPLLMALASTAPTCEKVEPKKNKTLVINENFFPDDIKIYSADHEIINLLTPLNDLNYVSDSETENKKNIFFVEADVTNGIEYKGLSVYKNGNVAKILPNGTSAAAETVGNTAYFGATDGLYKYNEKENTAEKYGPITDNIIDIAKANGTDIIYILTDKNEVYNVTENGTKKEQITDIVGAKEIVLDLSNNLYYYAEDKTPYVVTADGVKKIDGLPSNPDYIKLLRPVLVIEKGVPIILNNKAYIIYANGSNEFANIEFQTKPSAYALEATFVQYYARNKNIYEYDLVKHFYDDTITEVFDYFQDSIDEFEKLGMEYSSYSRS